MPEDFVIAKKTTRLLSFDIEDENEQAILPSDLKTMKLTLYDLRTGAAINSRTAQDVLGDGSGLNGVSITNNPGPPSKTTVAWTISPADSVIVDDYELQEVHVALFEFTYPFATGANAAHAEFRFIVKNAKKIT